jgi:hypothetical protein
LADLYDEAVPLFPALMLKQKIQGVMEQLEVSNKSLLGVGEELASFPDIFLKVDVPQLVQAIGRLELAEAGLEQGKRQLEDLPVVSVSLVEFFGRLCQFEGDLDGVREQLDGVPNVSVSLVEGMVKLERGSLDAAVVQAELQEVVEQYSVIEARLKEFPCDRLADGLCPYSDKLREWLK